MNDEIELLIDEDGTKYYVLKNSNLDLSNNNIKVFLTGKKYLYNKYYYQNKLIHREDGPAIENNDGYKAWYKNGLLDREDGPAIELDGTKVYYKNGLLDREDGPAMEYVNGYKAYYINGVQITEEKFYLEKELRESIKNNNIFKKNKI